VAQGRNFRLNKVQAFKLATVGYFSESDEVVIDADSYDHHTESFLFALKVHPERIPESTWAILKANPKGWSFFKMHHDGNFFPYDKDGDNG
jgi:hypothetical protein